MKTRKLATQKFGIPLAFPPWCEEINDVLEMPALDLLNDGDASNGGGYCIFRRAVWKHQRYCTGRK